MSVSATILIVEFLIIGVQTVVWGALFFYPDVLCAQKALVDVQKLYENYSIIISFFSLALIYSIGMIVDAATASLEDEISDIKNIVYGKNGEVAISFSFLYLMVFCLTIIIIAFDGIVDAFLPIKYDDFNININGILVGLILIGGAPIVGVFLLFKNKFCLWKWATGKSLNTEVKRSSKVRILLTSSDAYSEVMKLEFQSRLLRSTLFNYTSLLIVIYYKDYISFNATNITISSFIYALLYKAYRRRSGVYVKKKGQIISEQGRSAEQRPDINHS